jgi:hypothetical protein
MLMPYIYRVAFVNDGLCAAAEIVVQASQVQIVVDCATSFCFSFSSQWEVEVDS